jgi:hypothetical protein
LVDGIHIETHELEEALRVEGLVKESVQFIAEYFDAAVTFDGREELNEH